MEIRNRLLRFCVHSVFIDDLMNGGIHTGKNRHERRHRPIGGGDRLREGKTLLCQGVDSRCRFERITERMHMIGAQSIDADYNDITIAARKILRVSERSGCTKK